MKLTDATNAKQSAGAPARRMFRGDGAFGVQIALLIFPVIIMIAGLVMIGHMSPIYSGLRGLDYDPAYPYLFNGAGLMKGYNPSLTEHPGTPAQFAAGLVSIIWWSIVKLCGLTSLPFPASIAADSEQYLRAIMIAFLAMNAAAICWLGAVIIRLTGALAAAMACQAAYLLFGPLFPRMFHAAPEAFLSLAATALMCVLAPVLFADKECSDRRATMAGLFIGLGIASKANFFPLLLLAFLLKRPRPILIALSSGALFTLFFLVPIVGKFRHMFEWLFSIAIHEGVYGSGTAGFMDWAAIPERLGQIASAEPLLVVAAIALATVAACSNSRDRRKAVIIAGGAGALVFLVLKHFSVHYLMPPLAISPAIFVWALSRFPNTSRSYLIAAAAAALIGIAWTWNMSTEFAQERALRRANEKAVADAIARYDNPVVLGAYRAGYKPLAVLFGLAWSDLKFARLFPQTTAPDNLTYDSGLKKPWRAHSGPVDWSYLDRFEKAGRAVLVVQSRGYRIEPETAKTETIMDQGFGDTVERIMVTPKGGSN